MLTRDVWLPTYPDETWRPVTVPGYESTYDVSSYGRVRRSATAPRTTSGPGKILKCAPGKPGYLLAHLSRGGKVKTVAVHALVLMAFVGPRPPGSVCCHADGVKTNNHVSNLRWDTEVANHADAFRAGKIRAKLTPKQVKVIRVLLDHGRTMRDIGRMFGIHWVSVRAIRDGTSWKHAT